MSDLGDYLDERNVANIEFYNTVKDDIFCPICQSILIKPLICMRCQNNFCRGCIEIWNNTKSNINSCPFRRKNPEYKYSIQAGNLLSKLNFTCKDCSSIVNYDQMEKHVLSKCGTIEIKYIDDSKVDGIFKKVKMDNKNIKKFNEKSHIKLKSMLKIFNI
jgi:hypothetical protein